MKRLMAVTALLLLAVSAGAQRPPGPGGFSPPSPQMRAKFRAWQKWRATHKNVEALQQTLRELDRLERDPRARLNKKQASAVLAVLNKWRTRPALTDAQAQQVVHQIKAPLTAAQRSGIASAFFGLGPGGPPRGRFGGPPPPGGFRGPPPGGFRGPPPGGFRGPPPGGRGGGPPGGFNPAAFPSPRDYNPLNPKTSPFKREAPWAQQRLATLMATLAHTK